MSAYGNVPKDDVEAVRAALAHAARLSSELPIGAPAEWRDAAFEAILDGLLHDWVANGTTELEPDDLDDLSNLIRLACDAAMSADLPLRAAAFRCLIRGVMADWWRTGTATKSRVLRARQARYFIYADTTGPDRVPGAGR